MTIVRRLARPLLAAPFVYGGFGQLRRPSAKTDGGGPILPLLAGTSVGPVTIPSDTEALVRLNGGIMTAAGLLLAIGRAPRLSSLVLATSLVPTTLTGHRFWEAKDKETRDHQIGQVLKNAAAFGGLLIASVDTNGRPGLAWRAQHAAAGTQKSARKVGKKASKRAAKAQKRVSAVLPD